MKPRYRDVLAVIPDDGKIGTGMVAERSGYSHLDTRWVLNALEHQGLVAGAGGKVWLTDAGRRLKGRHVCIPSA